MGSRRARRAPTEPVSGRAVAPALEAFHPLVKRWFQDSFAEPTRAQSLGWPPIVAGFTTLLLAPTGSGKTLAAFLAALDRLMFRPQPERHERLRVLYVSPLKALGADIEKNLRAPIAQIAALAAKTGVVHSVPEVAVRSGDTPARERARFFRSPSDILITTPESLYLLLTSNARERLRSIDTLIADEIHSLVASKRGAHLSVSLERLEALRTGKPALQRIGLTATGRPVEELSRLLGGGTWSEGRWQPRPVRVADAGAKKNLEISVEMPVADLGRRDDLEPGTRADPRARASIWPSIHPRLVELIKAHRSTMIFVNSRRLAERLAAQLNELADEEIALAHHGSIARERRLEIEDRLKNGELRAIVATSSLELGIDMGAVDLVLQIEAPPSVASGLQRIGRAGHSVGAASRGRIFPKYRGDLLACAAAVECMLEGAVEATLYPRNPLDVLAQQVVAIAALDPIEVDRLYELVTQAAPFAELGQSAFEGVLDMLSGRYPSDEFAELRPRITWDRLKGLIHARQGARRIAITSGGTIPDRGLYGVFLVGAADGRRVRVGELDEEMVFESRIGDVFLLGASSWRIEQITHDRVLVSPAPGEPGKMPFWHGDRPGRPVELGRAIGRLGRELVAQSEPQALERLTHEHGLDLNAAKTLFGYLLDQAQATGEPPSDRGIVLERFVDEVGDYRVCVLSPFGARVHAPWAMAVATRYREEFSRELQSLWSDDGIVFRFPESGAPPASELFLPEPEKVEDWVMRGLGGTSLFATRFRENAARALLLPRRSPGRRSPLWAQRKRAQDLLAVAARYASFPILLETYRECLRDVFDLPALVELMRAVRSGELRVLTADSQLPSPFAASLLFSYVANFIYDGDAPLAERRAQALSVDQAMLSDLLGAVELRDLLDPEAIEALTRSLRRLDRQKLAHADQLHDLLLAIGDLSEAELRERAADPLGVAGLISELERAGRVMKVSIGGEQRLAASEDAGRLRDALGIQLPPGLPAALLEPVADPLCDLVSRYARTHGPFRVSELSARLGLPVANAQALLERLKQDGRLVEGEFLPRGNEREWCDAEVLRSLKRRSLARLRQEVEPVEPAALGRLYAEWQNVLRPRAGADALLDVIAELQGLPLPFSVLESEILPARVRGYRPSDLDLFCSAGEVVWRGVESLAPNDGKIALFLCDRFALLAAAPGRAEGELAARVRELLKTRGALFFADLVRESGGFSADVLDALRELVWAGEVTNDTLAPLRSMLGANRKRNDRRARHKRDGARRLAPPGSEGRWSLLPERNAGSPSETERRMALTSVLLDRYGIVTREAVAAEGIAGGFSAVYEVLKALEERGRIRRGYFVAGLGATQFARSGADERLRHARKPPNRPWTLVLGAADPANPYGAALPWPDREPRPGRVAGALVVLRNGELVAYLGRSERTILTFLPAEDPERSSVAADIAQALSDLVESGRRRALLIARIDGEDATRVQLGEKLVAAGFVRSSRGLFKRTAVDQVAARFERSRRRSIELGR